MKKVYFSEILASTTGLTASLYGAKSQKTVILTAMETLNQSVFVQGLNNIFSLDYRNRERSINRGSTNGIYLR
jgi:hypothetical protein